MDEALNKYLAEIVEQTKSLENMKRTFESLKSSACENEDQKQIEQQEAENSKLKYRISVLKKTISRETEIIGKKKAEIEELLNHASDNSLGLLEILKNIFSIAVKRAYMFLDFPDLGITSSASQHGDFQCTIAMPICQKLKTMGESVPPPTIAHNIVSCLPENDLILRAKIAGPGFINIFLKTSYVSQRVTDMILNGITPPKVERKLKVVVDFSSPNVAKEMHVGHLRSTIIGDSIANLLEYLNHDVVRVNHIGDWGTQFGMLIAHLQENFPNYRTESPSVGDLQRFYKESKIHFDNDEDFKKRAYECVVKLQNHDSDYIQAWKLICAASRTEFEKVYERLNIVGLIERGESFYQDRMKQLVADLEAKGLLEEDEGRKVMWGDDSHSNIPLTVVKSDGGFTYDTSDLAALKHRIEEEKADWIIYVVDEGQATHFQVLQNCAIRAGLYDPKKVRVDFVGFGVVLGEDKKKFKTRSGDTVRLAELLDEGLKRAEDKLYEKKRDDVLTVTEFQSARDAIAIGCIKYADLSHSRNHVYVFSFDKMLEDKGNTAVYLLYMYMRIRSIGRTANLYDEKIKNVCKLKPLKLTHAKELKLAKILLQFNDVIERVAKDLYLHRLCEYLYEVSTTFSELYDACYCIEKNAEGEIVKINVERIALCELTAMVMKQCFQILGIKTVDRM